MKDSHLSLFYIFTAHSFDERDFFFFKQKTAYEMRISDWSSDVCSSDLWMLFSPRTSSTPSSAARKSKCHQARRNSPSVTALRPAASCLRTRSEERRVGKECVSKCISRCTPSH